jgi:hypothetical protein
MQQDVVTKKPDPICVPKDGSEDCIVRVISNELGPNISESTDLFSIKMKLVKRFFGNDNVEVYKCEGKALATAIYYYLEKADELHLAVCSLGFTSLFKEAVFKKQ